MNAKTEKMIRKTVRANAPEAGFVERSLLQNKTTGSFINNPRSFRGVVRSGKKSVRQSRLMGLKTA